MIQLAEQAKFDRNRIYLASIYQQSCFSNQSDAESEDRLIISIKSRLLLDNTFN